MKITDKIMLALMKFHQKTKKWRRAILAISCVVVFTVTYALILPALTLEKDAAHSMNGISMETESGSAESESESKSDSKDSGSESKSASKSGSEGKSSSKDSGSDGAKEADQKAAQEDAVSYLDKETTFSCDGDEISDASIEVTANADSRLPVDSEFSAKEIRDVPVDKKSLSGKSDKEIAAAKKMASQYAAYYKASTKAVKDQKGEEFAIGKIRFFDMSFTSGDQEVQSASPVDVKISFDEAEKISDRKMLTAIHFVPDEDPVLVPLSEILPKGEKKDTVKEVAFSADSFSVWAVAEIRDLSAGELTYEGSDYTVTVQYDTDAQIPKGSGLKVQEIKKDTDEYQKYYDKAAETVSSDSLSFARFFDVSIEYDGEEIEPASPVSVQIAYEKPLEISKDQQVQAIHFAEKDGKEKPELLDISDKTSETEGSTEKVTDVTFQQDSFSVVGTVVAPVASGWPDVESTEGQVMVIKAANDKYYAVKQDGTLLEVDYSNDKVTFPSSISSTADLDKYLWYLSGSGTTRVIRSGDNHYISAYYYAGISNTDSYSDQNRDSSGHIYYTTLSKNYLTTNSEYTALAGQGKSSNAAVVYFVSSFTTGTTSNGWTEENGTKYMVVTADNSTYYAVKKDGSLVPVTIQSNSGAQTVIFGSTTGVTTENLGDFQWNLASGSGELTRSLSSGTAYLSPSADTGIASASVDLYRDSTGHIYTLDSSGDSPYHYLKMNGTSKVAGSSTGNSSISGVSADACAVALYSAASIAESGSGESESESESESSGSTETNSLGAPEASKTLTDNGDGTYEMALSVTGKTSALEENVKADVYIILDTSYSMVDENNNVNGETRFEVAQRAVIAAGNALLGQNTDGNDAVHLSLITFNNTATVQIFGSSEAYYTDDKNSFDSVMDNVSAPKKYTGTNWEDAFSKTAGVMSKVRRSDAQQYVIFVSDGNPTFRNTLGDYYTNQTYYLDNYYYGYFDRLGSYQQSHKAYSTINTGGTSITKTFNTEGTNAFIPDTRPDMPETSGLYGTGLDNANWAMYYSGDGNYYGVDVDTNITRCYDQAKDDALALGYLGKPNHYDAEFFSIRAFGDASRMNNMTRYVITGSDTGDLPANRAFDATNEDELTDAFDSIVSQILVDLMYTNVTVSDGLTGLTNTEAKVGDVLSESDFRYYKYGGSSGGTETNPIEITDEVNSEWPEANRAKYDSTTGKVTWNVCSSTNADGTDVAWGDIDDKDYYSLEDGVTYVVKFRVWPDQEAYDTLTSIHNAGGTARDEAYGKLSDDLKNKIYKNSDGEYVAKTNYASEQDVIDALQTIKTAGENAEDTAYNNLDSTITGQIYKDTNGDYRLHTNTDASVTYDVFKRTIEKPGPGETGLSKVDSGTETLKNPEGMILTDTTMKVFKVWEGDSAASRPAFVTLTIYEGDGATGENEQLYQTITLPNPNTDSNTWEYTIYISPALKVTDKSATPNKVITLEEGHTYRVGEVESSTVYTYTGETVRPYLKDTATEVKTNGSNEQGLTATNKIRNSAVTIKKANNADSLTSSDLKYLDGAHFQLLVKQFTGQDDDGHPTYQYVNYEATDSEGNTTSYEDFEIEDGSVGEVLSNLPSGEYKLVELSAPAGYILVDKEIFFKVNPSDSTNVLELNRYVPKTDYDSDTDVRKAVAAIKDAGFNAETLVYNGLSDDLKKKIVVDGYNEYVAKADYEDDADVISALSSLHNAGRTAEDNYYKSGNLTDEMRSKIYVSSNVFFTSSSETGASNDVLIVKNTEGNPLPSTGGSGTKRWRIAGVLLLLLASSGCLWMRNRKDRKRNYG